MLEIVSKEYKKQFHMIFMDASKCLNMLSGIDMKEDYPISNSYILVCSLSLTYEQKLSGENAKKWPPHSYSWLYIYRRELCW